MDEWKKQRMLEAQPVASLRDDLTYDLDDGPVRSLREEIYYSVQAISKEIHAWSDHRDGSRAFVSVTQDLERAARLIDGLDRLEEIEKATDDSLREEFKGKELPREEAPGKWSDDPEVAAIEQEGVKALADVASTFTAQLPTTSEWRKSFIGISDLDSARRIAELDKRMADQNAAAV